MDRKGVRVIIAITKVALPPTHSFEVNNSCQDKTLLVSNLCRFKLPSAVCH